MKHLRAVFVSIVAALLFLLVGQEAGAVELKLTDEVGTESLHYPGGLISVSPDGTMVVVDDWGQDASWAGEEQALVLFSREPTAGTLTHSQTLVLPHTNCNFFIPGTGYEDSVCNEPVSAEFDPSSLDLYVSQSSQELLHYRRSDDGMPFSFGECFRVDHIWNPAANGCEPISTLLANPGQLSVSPDGKNVYVPTSGFFWNNNDDGAVLAFERDPISGQLTLDQEVWFSIDDAFFAVTTPDGKALFVGTSGRGIEPKLKYFAREATTGALSLVGDYDLVGVGLPLDVVASPDSRFLYLVTSSFSGDDPGDSDSAVAALHVLEYGAPNAAPVLVQKLETQGASGPYLGARRVVITPSGRHLVVLTVEDKLLVHRVNPENGTLTLIHNEQLPSDCSSSIYYNLSGARSLEFSPDGADLYTPCFWEQAVYQYSFSGCSDLTDTSLKLRTVPGKPKRNRIIWRAAAGDPVFSQDFGSPTSSTSYALEVYRQGELVMSRDLEAGPESWRERKAGEEFFYEAVSGDRVTMRLRASEERTKRRVAYSNYGEFTFVAEGEGVLVEDVLPVGYPTTVRLRNSEGFCWEATFHRTARTSATTVTMLP